MAANIQDDIQIESSKEGLKKKMENLQYELWYSDPSKSSGREELRSNAYDLIDAVNDYEIISDKKDSQGYEG